MKFKQTDCTFLLKNIFAEISCILKEIIIIAANFLVRRFQSPLVYFVHLFPATFSYKNNILTSASATSTTRFQSRRFVRVFTIFGNGGHLGHET